MFPEFSEFLASWNRTIRGAGDHMLEEPFRSTAIQYIGAVSVPFIGAMRCMVQFHQLVSLQFQIEWIHADNKISNGRTEASHRFLW
jgi:hypothetical protein